MINDTQRVRFLMRCQVIKVCLLEYSISFRLIRQIKDRRQVFHSGWRVSNACFDSATLAYVIRYIEAKTTETPVTYAKVQQYHYSSTSAGSFVNMADSCENGAKGDIRPDE